MEKEQFIQLYALQKRKDEDEKEIKEAFRVLDKDKTGEIPVKELKYVTHQVIFSCLRIFNRSLWWANKRWMLRYDDQ